MNDNNLINLFQNEWINTDIDTEQLDNESCEHLKDIQSIQLFLLNWK